MVEPVPTGTFDECWLRQWPTSDQAQAMLPWSLLPEGSQGTSEVTLSQLNGVFGSSFDGAGLYVNRVTGRLGWIAPLAGLVISLAFGRLRRLEWSSSRHAGVTLIALELIAVTETAVAAIGAMALVAPVLTWLVLPLPAADLPGTVAVGVRLALSVGLGALVGTAVAVASAPERRLFAYFKSR